MNILYYSPHPHLNLMSPSGYGTHMREMIGAFRRQGCEVLPLIMGGEDNPPKEKLNRDDESTSSKRFLKKTVSNNLWRTLKDLKLLQFDYFTAANRLEKAINNFRPDCIYERCNYLQLSGIRLAKKNNIHHVMEINSPYVDQNNYLSEGHSYLERYARNIERKQVAGTTLPLAMVGPLRDYFCKRYDMNPGKFLVTHDAFNKDTIRLDSDNQQKISDKYQLSAKTVIGYIGSIFKWHGLDKFIKAFDELDIADTKLLIVGYGAYMAHLIELTKRLGREGEIIFTGRVPKEEIFDYITLMDICVAPDAAWYQSPVKIFEYGAMGKPILGPDTEAVREVMTSGKDGILVKPSVEGVKKGLHTLMNNSCMKREMAIHFQNKVLNEYTWDKNAERILEELNKRSG